MVLQGGIAGATEVGWRRFGAEGGWEVGGVGSERSSLSLQLNFGPVPAMGMRDNIFLYTE